MKARAPVLAAFALLALSTRDSIAQEQDHAHGGTEAGTPASNTSEREHVAPDPPALQMPEMSKTQMTSTMAMDDGAPIAVLIVDELEWRGGKGSDQLGWQAEGRYGGDYLNLWIRSRGARSHGRTESADLELLVDHVVARRWSLQAGVRHESGAGPDRDWLAFGLRGIAPGFLDIDATGYVGRDGRSALRLKAHYKLLLTQRLILRPSLELNIHGKNDPARETGSGLSDAGFGLRLEYEIRREFAPYAGIKRARQFGMTRRLSGGSARSTPSLQWQAGLRFWF